LGLYTSLIFSSCSSYRLNSSSSLVSLAKQFWAQNAFGGFRERLGAVPCYIHLHHVGAHGEFNREEALLLFGEMYATAVAGDGTVGPDRVELIVGGELGGGAALLRLAALHLLNELLPDELKFNVRIDVVEGRYYDITATGKSAAGLMRLLAVSAPSAGGKYLSEKFEEFVEAAKVEVRLDKNSIKLTDKGRVAADLIISEIGVAVKYKVYLSNKVELNFVSSDRSRVELATCHLMLAGVNAEVRKASSRDKWYVIAYTCKLAAR
jgi:hypothetical protein